MAEGSTCSEGDCAKEAQSRGLCRAHYQKRRRRHLFEPCAVAGCAAPRQGGDLCAKHYHRLRRTGTTDSRPKTQPCAVDGCPTPSRVRGWCNLHYRRWVRTGSPLKTLREERAKAARLIVSKRCTRCQRKLLIGEFSQDPRMFDGRRSHCKECARLFSLESKDRQRERETPCRSPKEPQICAVDDCSRTAHCKGWCKRHYERWRRHGDPTKLLRRPNQDYKQVLASGVKRCSRCGLARPLCSFSIDNTRQDGRTRYCIDCINNYAKSPRQAVNGTRFERGYWQRQFKDPQQRQYAMRLWGMYQMTLEDYDRLLTIQGNACAICGEIFSGDLLDKRLLVDHCHSTGRVRGLLCSNCNTGLGQFKDDPDRLRAAVDYLARTAVVI